MEKLDLKKTLISYNAKKGKPEFVNIPAMNFLMVDGHGDPNTSKEFQDAIETLYSVAYTLKFMFKKREAGVDYGVMPLEALWWADDMDDFIFARKDKWFWTAMILQPDFVTKEDYSEALRQAKEKKILAAADKIRFEKFEEGLCGQVLHIGPFADEGPTIAMLHEHIKNSGYALSGKHHEIYLSDMRRTAPEKLKTIIRQPVAQPCN